MIANSLLGQGLYTPSEAAKIVGVPTATLRRWILGESRTVRRKLHSAEPLIRVDLDGVGEEPVLTFQNLIELLFISLFRKEGVSLQTIRVAAEKAAQLFDTDHPFAVQRFDTDGKRIFATLEDLTVEGIPRAKLLQELILSQMVMEVLARPFFKNLEYDNFGAQRYWPLGQAQSIVLDPHRSFGQPIDHESGVPTLALYQMARGGESVKAIANWYGVHESAVVSAIEFESSMHKAA